MSDSQRFPVAAHDHGIGGNRGRQAGAGHRVRRGKSVLVGQIGQDVRRVTAMLARAGLIGTRTGAGGGAWLLRQPDKISLETVLRAVNGCAHFGAPPAGAKGCPVGEAIPRAIAGAIKQADAAAAERLAKITVADLLNSASAPDVAA